ncbi:MAG: NUDIX domain-containing protein [Flavobacteriales bacterium]|jgi:ADP-ribose pyrophosphatase YjhB (NUDIX family)|nr:NUDIX domain-containing protein [Flavobacteriales bacterium]
MYKVFVNDKPIFLTTEMVFDKNARCFPLKGIDLETVVKKVARGKWEEVYLYHPNGEKLLQKFKKKIPVVVAAGGLVTNELGEILFIKRNGKWDLPKGRVEIGESLEEAAIRETEEETGVKDLKIIKSLQITYHIFNRNDKMKLKETYWYAMETSYKGSLHPEKSEGIKKVAWKNEKKAQKALLKSYANIKELFYQKV